MPGISDKPEAITFAASAFIIMASKICREPAAISQFRDADGFDGARKSFVGDQQWRQIS
jgi:hypothetical protein